MSRKILTRNFLLSVAVICAGVYLLFVNSDSMDMSDFVSTTIGIGQACNCDYRNYILGPGGRQDDPCLVEIVRNQFIIPPSQLPYNLDNSLGSKENPDISSNQEKFRLIKNYIMEQDNPGFFIECGANDGEFISPTIKLEKEYNWTGLLVEANSEPFEKLSKKNRRAWIINAAACITEYAAKLTFFTHPTQSGWGSFNERLDIGVKTPQQIQCIPMYTMLKAINVTTVDYLSLDVEGSELSILKTIPFERIQFKFLTVEHWSIPGGRKPLQDFLLTKGYHFVKDISDSYTRDSAYVHHSLLDRFKNEMQVEPTPAPTSTTTTTKKP